MTLTTTTTTTTTAIIIIIIIIIIILGTALPPCHPLGPRVRLNCTYL